MYMYKTLMYMYIMKSTEVLNPRRGFITHVLVDKLDDLATCTYTHAYTCARVHACYVHCTCEKMADLTEITL